MVQDDVRGLCGVAQSNSKVFPGKFVACFAIALGKAPQLMAFRKTTDNKQLAIDSVSVKIKNVCESCGTPANARTGFHQLLQSNS